MYFYGQIILRVSGPLCPPPIGCATEHVEFVVVVSCNQLLYLLAQLHKQGVDITTLDTIFSIIMYALPVYYGYLIEHQKHQLQQICDRAKHRCLTLYEKDFIV